jgi:hypothetical protein
MLVPSEYGGLNGRGRTTNVNVRSSAVIGGTDADTMCGLVVGLVAERRLCTSRSKTFLVGDPPDQLVVKIPGRLPYPMP